MGLEPPKYDDQNIYSKHQAGCDATQDTCECCPPGLVAVFDECGNKAGCLTPHDAEHYNKNKHTCGEGYMKLVDPNTGDFLGCVTPEEASTLLAQLSDTIDHVPTPETSEQFNVINGVETINGSAGAGILHDMTVEIDRVNTSDPIVIQMAPLVSPPPAGVTLVASPVVIDGPESTKAIQINIDASVAANVYNFNLELVGAGVTKVIPVVLTLT